MQPPQVNSDIQNFTTSTKLLFYIAHTSTDYAEVASCLITTIVAPNESLH